MPFFKDGYSRAAVVDGVIRVQCVGKLNLPLVGIMIYDIEGFMEQGSKHFVLDMSEVEEITAEGVAFLAGYSHRRAGQGVSILLGIPPQVRIQILSVYGDLFEYVYSVDSEAEVAELIAQATPG